MFNAGIAGYTIIDELALLREKAIAFSLKLVVLAVFENDLADMKKESTGTMRQSAAGEATSTSWLCGGLRNLLAPLRRHLALNSIAERLKTKWDLARAGADIQRGEGQVGAPAALPDDERLAARYRDRFCATADLLHQNGIAFAAIFIPSADLVGDGLPSLMRPVLEAAAAETHTPYLDPTPVLAATPDAAERFYLLNRKPGTNQLTGNGHLSREGNAVIGKAVAEWLMQQALVPSAQSAKP